MSVELHGERHGLEMHKKKEGEERDAIMTLHELTHKSGKKEGNKTHTKDNIRGRGYEHTIY